MLSRYTLNTQMSDMSDGGRVIDSRTPDTPVTRKVLMDKIATLGSTEHAEIFRILKKHDIPHTQNKNGIFINITSVAPEVVKEVSDFVRFCAHNNKELEEYDKRLNQCKLYQNLDCMSTPPTGSMHTTHGQQQQHPLKKMTSAAIAASVPPRPGSNMHRFFESLEHSMETLGRRHHTVGSSKYAAARKKYSKRNVQDSTRSGRGQAAAGAMPVEEELQPETTNSLVRA